MTILVFDDKVYYDYAAIILIVLLIFNIIIIVYELFMPALINFKLYIINDFPIALL